MNTNKTIKTRIKRIKIKIIVPRNPMKYFDDCRGVRYNCSDDPPHSIYKMWEFVALAKDAERYGFDLHDVRNKFGGPVTTSDGWVEVWCHDELGLSASEDIPKDHPIFSTRYERCRGPLAHLPVRWAKRIAEGGFTTKITNDDGEIIAIKWIPDQEYYEHEWIPDQEHRLRSVAEAIAYVEESSSKCVCASVKKAYEEYLKAWRNVRAI